MQCWSSFFSTIAVNTISGEAVLLVSNPQLVLQLKVDPAGICLHTHTHTCCRFRCLCVWELAGVVLMLAEADQIVGFRFELGF